MGAGAAAGRAVDRRRGISSLYLSIALRVSWPLDGAILQMEMTGVDQPLWDSNCISAALQGGDAFIRRAASRLTRARLELPPHRSILDRFLAHATIVQITGKSYRLRLRATADDD